MGKRADSRDGAMRGRYRRIKACCQGTEQTSRMFGIRRTAVGSRGLTFQEGQKGGSKWRARKLARRWLIAPFTVRPTRSG